MEDIVVNGDAIELHYWFEDHTHSMDAIVQHKCEAYILSILKTIGTTFEVDITIETEPFLNGGLRRWFRVVRKNEAKNPTIGTTIIISVFTFIILQPIGTIIQEVAKKIIEAKFDKEKRSLRTKKLNWKIII